MRIGNINIINGSDMYVGERNGVVNKMVYRVPVSLPNPVQSFNILPKCILVQYKTSSNLDFRLLAQWGSYYDPSKLLELQMPDHNEKG